MERTLDYVLKVLNDGHVRSNRELVLFLLPGNCLVNLGCHNAIPQIYVIFFSYLMEFPIKSSNITRSLFRMKFGGAGSKPTCIITLCGVLEPATNQWTSGLRAVNELPSKSSFFGHSFCLGTIFKLIRSR